MSGRRRKYPAAPVAAAKSAAMTPMPAEESGRLPAKVLTAPTTQMKVTRSTSAARTLRAQIIDPPIFAQSPLNAIRRDRDIQRDVRPGERRDGYGGDDEEGRQVRFHRNPSQRYSQGSFGGVAPCSPGEPAPVPDPGGDEHDQ